MLGNSYNSRMRFLFLSENLALIASVFIAALIKVGSAGRVLHVEFGLGKAVFAAIVFQVCLYFCDLYDLNVRASHIELARRLAGALLVATLVLGLVYTVFPMMMLIPGIWLWNAAIALVT